MTDVVGRTSREDVLGRIRQALGPDRTTPAEVTRDYRLVDGRPPGDSALLELLVDRVEDYRASVLRCGPDEVAGTVVAALDQGVGAGWAPGDVVVAPGLPGDWRPAGSEPIHASTSGSRVTASAHAAKHGESPAAYDTRSAYCRATSA